MDWSDLDGYQWQGIYAYLDADDTARAMSTSFGMMTLGGGFGVLTEIMQGFYSLIDFYATVEQKLAIRTMQEELHDLFYSADWSVDAEADY